MTHPNGHVLVRQAQPSDAPLCLAFERKDEFGAITAIDEKLMAAQIALGAVFIAECDDQPVGYVSLNFLYASRKPMLSWWYVEQAHRGQGIGAKLMSEVEHYLHALGFTKMLISACREKEIARHRAAGLDELGMIRLGDGEDEYFFAKHITPRGHGGAAA